MSEWKSDMTLRPNRRGFLKAGVAATGALLANSALADAPKAFPALPANPKTLEAMPTRNLGKTGYKVALFSLGGQGILEYPNKTDIAVPIIERALDLGVNYFDTSSVYGAPERWSELYLGTVMQRRRSEAFLASKTKERTRDGSLRMIERSLQLLHTDHLDLWQIHDLGSIEDVDAIFAKGGAMEALQEMREQKVVRSLGLTGHYRPEPLVEGIRRFPFDTVLMSFNAADPHHYSFSEVLLPLAVERQMGIIAMKVLARGRILSTWKPPTIEQQQHSWEGMNVQAPTSGALTLREALFYTWTQPISTVIVGCDTVAQLEENVRLAREFTPYSAQQEAELTARVADTSKQSVFFRFENRNPTDWMKMGPPPPPPPRS